jgi:hypothetical protein
LEPNHARDGIIAMLDLYHAAVHFGQLAA